MHALTMPPLRLALTLVLSAGLLAACSPGAGAPGGPPGAGMPPTEVGVVTVKLGDIGLPVELPGRLEASRTAQVRARVAGILQQRLFREGSDVRPGQLLYRIDPAAYAAALDAAQATLARAEANLTQASTLAERYRPLAEARAVSQQDYTSAVAAQKQAEADVASGKAAVQTARINLDYARVTAPIGGRIGRTLVTEGALVGQGEVTPLATIQQIDPMYVNFTQSAAEAMALRRALEAGQFKRAGSGQAASARIVLEDGSLFGKPARLLFSDLTVDPGTGQIQLRAEVPNPGGVLLPGLFVRVRIEQSQAPHAVALPQQAVTRSSQGDSVLVVAADGKVGPVPVKVGSNVGSQWVILDGLKDGDQVMVDGFQKLRGGAPVKAVPWQPQGAGVPAAPASAASAAAKS